MTVMGIEGYSTTPATPADVAIVGAGPAGLALAIELDRRGHRTLLLESGGRDRFDKPAADLNTTLAGAPLGESCSTGRARGLGGSSQLWAGQLLPLSPSELDVEPGDALGGWPLRHTDLCPFWRRAERFFGTDDAGYDLRAWPVHAPRPPALVPDLQFRFSQFIQEPDMGKRYRRFFESSTSTTVLLGATVVGLPIDQRGDVSGLQVAAPDGTRIDVTARQYVLACGAIEIARILLTSRLSEHLPLVGRCFMEHIGVAIPIQRPSKQLNIWFNSRPIAGRRCLPRLTLTGERPDGRPPLNIGLGLARLMSRPMPLSALKTVLSSGRTPLHSMRHPHTRQAFMGAAQTVLRESPAIASAAVTMRRHGHKFAEVVGQPALSINVDVLPRRDNRVVLSQDHDRLGVAVPGVVFGVHPQEWAAMREVARVIAGGFARLGLGHVETWRLPESIDEAVGRGMVVPALHHMGTTRMSEGPTDGVVDRNCRVHGCSNLRVAGAAAFPTGGLSNPTLTLVALSIRLGDQLHSEL
jgi:choline dehydrogenase-like flavoprotein